MQGSASLESLMQGPVSKESFMQGPASNESLMQGPASNESLMQGPASNESLWQGPASKESFIYGTTFNSLVNALLLVFSSERQHNVKTYSILTPSIRAVFLKCRKTYNLLSDIL